MSPVRKMLGWSRPLLPQVAENLVQNAAAGSGPADLSDMLVVVPTRQAGRRLREALVHAVPAAGLFPPRIVTPEALLAPVPGAKVAAWADRAAAWIEALGNVVEEDAAAIFPAGIPDPAGVAFQLLAVQDEVAGEGLDFSALAVRVAATDYEPARWAALGRLEEAQQAVLERRCLADPNRSRIAATADAAPPDGVGRVVVACVSDPLPLVLRVLERWCALLPVEVLMHGPEDGGDLFDGWGRPLEEAFASRLLPLGGAAAVIRVAADPAAVADLMAEAAGLAGAPEAVALGIADPAVAPHLARRLRDRGLAPFDPAGEPAVRTALGDLVSRLVEFAERPQFRTLVLLARHPDIAAWLAAAHGPGFSQDALLAGLDELHLRHLPVDLEAARALCGGAPEIVRDVLGTFGELHGRLNSGPRMEAVGAVLEELFAGRMFSMAQPADAALIEAAGTVRDRIAETAAAEAAHPGPAPATWGRLLLEQLGDLRLYPARVEGAFDLPGWIELPWEDAPWLLAGGMNEGVVPSSVVGDPFLPEALRRHLGMRTNARRYARDAHLLEALLRSRAEGGRVDLLVARESCEGDPMKPSRLLFHCSDAELPARVLRFAGEAEEAPAAPARSSAWLLRPVPGACAPPGQWSPTRLHDYLQCPFRFYLKHAARVGEADFEKRELDALEFGTLCHEALKILHNDKTLEGAEDEAVLFAALEAEVKRLATGRHGDAPPLPVLMQIDAAVARLHAAARAEAQLRAEGWTTTAVEEEFTVQLGGRMLQGRVDRIDRHRETGAWRILDYKTSDTAKAPAAAHLVKYRGVELEPFVLPEAAGVRVDGREMRWADLQLPLYRLAFAGRLEGGAVEVGYINLPKTLDGTGVMIWEDLTPDLMEQAENCAVAVMDAVERGRFWPPAEIAVERDAFASLYPGGIAADVDAAAFAALERRAAP